MKRIGTALVILFSFIAVGARGQSARINPPSNAKTLTTVAQPAKSAEGAITGSNGKNSDGILSSVFKTEAVGYFIDTSGGNWWVYSPVLNQADGDSVGYFRAGQFTDGQSLYFINDDTIGPEEIGFQRNNVIVDTTANDTMYNRVMGLRITPPTDLGTTVYLDSVNIPIYVEALDPGDLIRVLAVPIADQELTNNTGPFPFPDLLYQTPIAKETISPTELTTGQLNSITVSFGKGGKSLSTVAAKNVGENNEFAICVYVDGPNYANDTVGYMLEADPQSPPATFSIDTDGTGGVYMDQDGNPIQMRSYLLGLDNGNLTIDGTTSPISGGQYLVEISQVDNTGAPTSEEFDGNFAFTTYFHGTVTAGVASSEANQNYLADNYPNPVSGTTGINYNLANSGPVELKVYNALGEQVASLVNGMQSAGAQTATFDASKLPNGIYLYRLQAGDFVDTKSMVVSK